MNNLVPRTKNQKPNRRNSEESFIGYDGQIHYLGKPCKPRPYEKRKQAPSTPQIEFMRSVSFGLIHGDGIKTKAGEYGVPWNNGMDELNRKYRNRDEYRRAKRWHRANQRKPHPTPNHRYREHYTGGRPLYYQGGVEGKTLVCHDYDVQKSLKRGTSIGADNFRNRVNKFFPKPIHVEVSNGGNGRSGYWVLNYGWYIEKALDELARHDDLLKRLLIAENHDLENIEIKGLPPEHNLATDMTGVQIIKAGSFAKVPKQEAVIETCELTLAEFTAINDHVEKEVLKLERAMPWERSTEVKELKRNGSCGGQWRTNERMIEEYNNAKAYATAANHQIKTSGRQIVIAEDEALKHVVHLLKKKYPNEDGTFPHRQAEALWKIAQEIVGSERAFDCHRWTAMRNHDSAMGANNWSENKYCPGGKACKWSPKQEYLEWVNDVGEFVSRGGDFVGTQVDKHFGGLNLRPRNRLLIGRGDEFEYRDLNFELFGQLAA